eukprot:2654013-Prymnesium_polylepis.1
MGSPAEPVASRRRRPAFGVDDAFVAELSDTARVRLLVWTPPFGVGRARASRTYRMCSKTTTTWTEL